MKKTSFFIILVLIILFAYPTFKIRSAHERVEQLFRQVTLSMPISQVEEEAKILGLKVIRFEEKSPNFEKIIAWDGWAFARWNCVIQHANGKAVSKKIVFLD